MRRALRGTGVCMRTEREPLCSVVGLCDCAVRPAFSLPLCAVSCAAPCFSHVCVCRRERVAMAAAAAQALAAPSAGSLAAFTANAGTNSACRVPPPSLSRPLSLSALTTLHHSLSAFDAGGVCGAVCLRCVCSEYGCGERCGGLPRRHRFQRAVLLAAGPVSSLERCERRRRARTIVCRHEQSPVPRD